MVVEARLGGKIKVEDSCNNGRSDIDEKSSNLEVLSFAFDFDSDAIPLGDPRCAEHTERLPLCRWKVKN